jgi:hypothetical protein
MHHTIRKLPDEPITIWTPTQEWNWAADMAQVNAEFAALWTASNEPIYHIIDVQHYQFDLDGLATGAASLAFGENAMFNHPKLKVGIIVTQDPNVIFAFNSMSSNMKKGTGVYEAVPMLLMNTLDEALAYIRKERGQART